MLDLMTNYDLRQLWNRIDKQFDLKHPPKPPIQNLVIEGGGVKGIGFYGALEVLEKEGKLNDIKRVAGSSAGGIVSVMLALGCSAKEIGNILENELDIKALCDPKYKSDPSRIFKLGGLNVGASDIFALFKNKGLYKGDVFLEFSKLLIKRKLEESLKKIIQAREAANVKIIRQKGIQNNKSEKEITDEISAYINKQLTAELDKFYIDDLSNISFSQLNALNAAYPSMGLKELFITGTRLSDASLKVFSAESDPNMPICEALRITMSFPFAFEPVLYDGDYYADGGIADNYPMSIFDKPKYLEYGLNESNVNPCTLGLLVDSKEEIDSRWGINQEDGEIEIKVGGFVQKILHGLHNRSYEMKSKYHINSIQIFDEEVQTLDFHLSKEQIDKLIASGRKAMQQYIDLYESKDAIYSYASDYDSSEEKYNSKSEAELKRILENELFPLIKEFHQLAIVDYKGLLAEIHSILNQCDPVVVQSQIQLYNKLDLLATEMESVDDRRKSVEQQLKELEKENRILWDRIDNLSDQEKDLNTIAQLYDKQTRLTNEKKRLRSELVQLIDMINNGQHRYHRMLKEIDSNVFPMVEKMKQCQLIVDEKLDVKFKETILRLNDDMNMVLKIIRINNKDYPDPRELQGIDKAIHDLNNSDYDNLMRFYTIELQLDNDEAHRRAMERITLIDDFIAFGSTVAEAKEMASQLEVTKKLIPYSEARIRLLSSFLVQKLIEKNLISDQIDEISLVKKFYKERLESNLKLYPEMSLSEHECAVKKEIMDNCKSALIHSKDKKYGKPKIPKTLREECMINALYSDELSSLVQCLSAGKWSSSISYCNRANIEHNYKHQKVIDGESYGLHKSNASIKTLNFTDKGKQYIKAHLLTPDPATIQKPEITTKELIIVFENTNREEHINYLYSTELLEQRKQHFEKVKNNIVKQILWSVQKMEAQGIKPVDADLVLTVYGEGLGGYDAQLLSNEIISQLQNNKEMPGLSRITNLNLMLKDPIRVSDQMAQDTAQKLDNIQNRGDRFKVTGYNQIHRSRFHRKTQNYIGEANLLSYVPSKNADLMVDVRSENAPRFQYELFTNKTERFNKYLNKRNPILGGYSYRVVKYFYKKAKTAFTFVFDKMLPFAYQVVKTIGYSFPKRLLKNLLSPLTRLRRVFRRTKTYQMPMPSWVEILNHKKLSKDNLDKSPVKSNLHNTLEDNLNSFVNHAQPSNRLKSESRPPIENIVFEGGGVRAFAYVGALTQMDKYHMLDNVKRVSGSSTGGIFASFLALGFNPAEIKNILMNHFNLKDLMDEPLSLGGLDTLFNVHGENIGIVAILSLFKNKGIYKGDALKEMMSHLARVKLESGLKHILSNSLSEKEIDYLLKKPENLSQQEREQRIDYYLTHKLNLLKRKYGIEDFGLITLSQMNTLGHDYPALNIKELYLTGTCMTDASLKIFSAESDPDLPLVDAVRISMSYPGGFMPVQYNGEYYTSGGIANNYPIQIFDQPQFLTHGVNDAGVNPCTFGLLVDTEEEIKNRWGIRNIKSKDTNIIQFIGSILAGIRNRSDVLRDKYNINSVQLSDNISNTSEYKGADSINYDLSKSQKQKLVYNGEQEIQRYYANYMGSTIQYMSIPSYDSMMQKYYAKSALELKIILNEEVTPLLARFDQIYNELIQKRTQLELEIVQLNTSLEDHYNDIKKMEKIRELDVLIDNEAKKLNTTEDSILKIDMTINSTKKLLLDNDISSPRKSELQNILDMQISKKNDYMLLADRKRQRLGKYLNEKEALGKQISSLDVDVIVKINHLVDQSNKLAYINHAFEVYESLLQECEVINSAIKSKVSPEIAKRQLPLKSDYRKTNMKTKESIHHKISRKVFKPKN